MSASRRNRALTSQTETPAPAQTPAPVAPVTPVTPAAPVQTPAPVQAPAAEDKAPRKPRTKRVVIPSTELETEFDKLGKELEERRRQLLVDYQKLAALRASVRKVLNDVTKRASGSHRPRAKLTNEAPAPAPTPAQA